MKFITFFFSLILFTQHSFAAGDSTRGLTSTDDGELGSSSPTRPTSTPDTSSKPIRTPLTPNEITSIHSMYASASECEVNHGSSSHAQTPDVLGQSRSGTGGVVAHNLTCKSPQAPNNTLCFADNITCKFPFAGEISIENVFFILPEGTPSCASMREENMDHAKQALMNSIITNSQPYRFVR